MTTDNEDDSFFGAVKCGRGMIECEDDFFSYITSNATLLISPATPVGNYSIELTLSDLNLDEPKN